MNTKFRRRGQGIEAMEFTYPATMQFMGFCEGRISNIRKTGFSSIAECSIRNLEGEGFTMITQKAYEGDYIVKLPNDELTVMKPMYFKMMYEKVSSEELYPQQKECIK